MERRPVVGYEGLYEVSDDGLVFSMTRRLKSDLRSTAGSDGGLVVELTKDGVCKKCRIHRLVAMAFIDNQNNYDVVAHIDGDKNNNRSTNLVWRDSRMDIVNHYAAFITRTGKVRRKEFSVFATDILTGLKLTFKSIKSAESHGFNPLAIESCCKGRCKSYAGYSWRYNNE